MDRKILLIRFIPHSKYYPRVTSSPPVQVDEGVVNDIHIEYDTDHVESQEQREQTGKQQDQADVSNCSNGTVSCVVHMSSRDKALHEHINVSESKSLTKCTSSLPEESLESLYATVDMLTGTEWNVQCPTFSHQIIASTSKQDDSSDVIGEASGAAASSVFSSLLSPLKSDSSNYIEIDYDEILDGSLKMKKSSQCSSKEEMMIKKDETNKSSDKFLLFSLPLDSDNSIEANRELESEYANFTCEVLTEAEKYLNTSRENCIESDSIGKSNVNLSSSLMSLFDSAYASTTSTNEHFRSHESKDIQVEISSPLNRSIETSDFDKKCSSSLIKCLSPSFSSSSCSRSSPPFSSSEVKSLDDGDKDDGKNIESNGRLKSFSSHILSIYAKIDLNEKKKKRYDTNKKMTMVKKSSQLESENYCNNGQLIERHCQSINDDVSGKNFIRNGTWFTSKRQVKRNILRKEHEDISSVTIDCEGKEQVDDSIVHTKDTSKFNLTRENDNLNGENILKHHEEEIKCTKNMVESKSMNARSSSCRVEETILKRTSLVTEINDAVKSMTLEVQVNEPLPVNSMKSRVQDDSLDVQDDAVVVSSMMYSCEPVNDVTWQQEQSTCNNQYGTSKCIEKVSESSSTFNDSGSNVFLSINSEDKKPKQKQMDKDASHQIVTSGNCSQMEQVNQLPLHTGLCNICTQEANGDCIHLSYPSTCSIRLNGDKNVHMKMLPVTGTVDDDEHVSSTWISAITLPQHEQRSELRVKEKYLTSEQVAGNLSMKHHRQQQQQQREQQETINSFVTTASYQRVPMTMVHMKRMYPSDDVKCTMKPIKSSYNSQKERRKSYTISSSDVCETKNTQDSFDVIDNTFLPTDSITSGHLVSLETMSNQYNSADRMVTLPEQGKPHSNELDQFSRDLSSRVDTLTENREYVNVARCEASEPIYENIVPMNQRQVTSAQVESNLVKQSKIPLLNWKNKSPVAASQVSSRLNRPSVRL